MGELEQGPMAVPRARCRGELAALARVTEAHGPALPVVGAKMLIYAGDQAEEIVGMRAERESRILTRVRALLGC